jgi:hypothetical protein
VKSTVFSLLVWLTSNFVLSQPAAGWAASGHMLRTLRGWAIAAFFITLAMHWLRPALGELRQPKWRDALSGFIAFVIFSGFTAVLIAARNSVTLPLAADALTLVGGGLAPVIALMALEFPDLRPRSFTLAAMLTLCLISLVGLNSFAVKPGKQPGTIRTHQPAGSQEPALGTTIYNL